ncbi:hypothetical protein GPECTOR_7g1206 [Gonium pectorale]|uniref:Uncharacterized protein n=1 Tax=Gonium pectorale TaxID=33097 RepID=A0A150GU98_GONPE|nr:hypothetical protein GPECTOR_7g1206 [Gonium pectorale]|eukprot:KXZ53312.1 hypothetical protein GPECTOR_7g1206 [Gonium pectorale]
MFDKDQLSVRMACRDMRDAYDQSVSSISVTPFRIAFACMTGELGEVELPSPDVVTRAVEGMRARGLRPSTISFHMPWTEDAALHEQRVLALLRALAGTDAVTDVGFNCHTPITTAVARAVATFIPKLESLFLTHGPEPYELGPHKPPPHRAIPPPPQPAEVESAAASVVELLRLTGPSLKTLFLCADAGGRHVPAQALRSVSFCSSLRSLQLALPPWPESVDSMAQVLADEDLLLQDISVISTLRSLELTGGGCWVPPAHMRLTLADALGSALSRLTGLTCLKIRVRRLTHYWSGMSGFDPMYDASDLNGQVHELLDGDQVERAQVLLAAAAAEWRVVAAAVRRMPGLAELRVPMRANLADLTALTALTCLRVGQLVSPEAFDAMANTAAIGGTLATHSLPPSLRRLETHIPLSVRVLASLQPAALLPGAPPCSLLACGRLRGRPNQAWCLDFERMDVAAGRLTPEAVATFRRAVFVLGHFDVRDPDWNSRGVCVCAGREVARPPLPPVDVDNVRMVTHFSSWMGELVALRLEWLALSNMWLTPQDLRGMAHLMGGLKGLELRGSRYAPAGLLQLAGMQELKALRLGSDSWREIFEDDEFLYDSLDGVFLALTAAPAGKDASWPVPLPKLQWVQIFVADDEVEDMEAALASAKANLESRGSGARLYVSVAS